MKLALGSDHRGDAATRALAEHLRGLGHEIVVFEPCNGDSCDYPDRAYPVAKAVSDGRAERGILLCGSGIGVAIAANKVPGVRAAPVTDGHVARLSRQHNDANVLCMGADRTSLDEMLAVVDVWLDAQFEGGRHARRVEKIHAIERGEEPG
ncbi:MAG: ribose 5-phosphate isomerase B [Planctomycetota bacterium]|jgi:ribose 5-phosphate isomerase B